MSASVELLQRHKQRLLACSRCPEMIGPVITGQPVASGVLLVGQAPGPREGALGKPFAWTAGKTLFSWFERIGLDEEHFRKRVYMAAVCRCFPGKNPRGGDRVPSPEEIKNCSSWLDSEFEIIRPKLVIPVGKLAIAQFIQVKKLADVVGDVQRIERSDHTLDLACLPHPSGASTWHRTEPGKTLLADGLAAIAGHPAWRALL